MIWTTLLVLVLTCSSQIIAQTKEGKRDEDSMQAIAEMASSFLNSGNSDQIGSILSNLVQSDGGQQIGSMLMGMAENKNANQILQSLGSLMGQGQDDSSSNGGFDPSIVGTVLSALASAGDSQSEAKKNEENPLAMLSTLGSLFAQGQGQGEEPNLMSLLPMVLNTISAFTGGEAQKRADSHQNHSWLLPPILEYFHVLADHFVNSELGKAFVQSVESEKFIKVFSDSNGKFNWDKFLELVENQSFRKHWIEMFTRRISEFIAYYSDPSTHKKFLATGQYFLNTFLKTQAFPKHALFDPTRPSETLTNGINYAFKKYLNFKVSSKQYVKPAVTYLEDLLALARTSGMLNGKPIDSRALSNKLADTLNLEIIEPLARVYRAFRFVKKVPECDRYVMCLINQRKLQEPNSLPGLSKFLSRTGSIVASWFLGSPTGTSFWTLYNAIDDEENCKKRYRESCNEFHLEELRVTTEYFHNEL